MCVDLIVAADLQAHVKLLGCCVGHEHLPDNLSCVFAVCCHAFPLLPLQIPTGKKAVQVR